MCTVDQLIFKKPQMSVMRLGMHNKSWDNMMVSQLSYKMDRPAYSTPPPVENIPTNNECTMVELRGSKVASFTLGCDEYICLPQAFDLFLKHLVGGLHTVYTKLKRLNITPVVCNVEQVRVLRGLGAIQPGVNRCKLITRKDFEILYQDCTTASRPGRPPKRYPTLTPSSDLMSPHGNLRGNPTFSQTDFSGIPKRMRFGPSMLDQQHDKRAAGSPTKDKENPPTPLSLLSSDMHNNPCANLAYLQQAIRQQYQQAAMSGLHHGLDPQQINPALNPFMMMSHPSLFSSGIPPTSMAMLNHINQMAQNHIATGGVSPVVAQLTGRGAKLNQAPVSSSGQTSSSGSNGKGFDEEDTNAPRSFENPLELSNGIGSDGRASPGSSLGSPHNGMQGHLSDSCDQTHNPFSETFKDEIGSKSRLNDLSDAMRELAPKMSSSSDDEAKPLENNNLSAMRTLLTNIQGLIKVAADNACLQEKHASMEIAEIKLKLSQEKQLRELAEQKLHDCDKEKVEAEKRYYKEKKENKKLQGQIVSMQQILSHDVTSHSNDDDLETSSLPASSPSSAGAASIDALSETSSTSATSPVTSSFSPNAFVPRTPVCQSGGKSNPSSPVSGGNLSISSIGTNINNNNNHCFEGQKSPDHSGRAMKQEPKIPDIAIDLGRVRNQHSAFQDQLNFFKNPSLLYQRAATQ